MLKFTQVLLVMLMTFRMFGYMSSNNMKTISRKVVTSVYKLSSSTKQNITLVC